MAIKDAVIKHIRGDLAFYAKASSDLQSIALLDWRVLSGSCWRFGGACCMARVPPDLAVCGFAGVWADA